MLLMMWEDSLVNQLEFVTDCSCSAAKQLSGSWPAAARHHGAMHMN